jgi:aminoglycoside phosphotransferase family enzyme/predicted kinase
MASEQDEVVAFLSRPDTYGADSVALVETHASIVFLADDRAYKLKQAVRYSYLDYSTPPLRRAACEAELAINRRFSPDLYLEVAAITRAKDGSLCLRGQGEPVDWVVVMRRFAAEDQLDHVAERGGLTRKLAFDLADRIAAAHDAAKPSLKFGGAHGLGSAIQITIDNLRLAAGSILAAEPIEAWSRNGLQMLEDFVPLLEERRLAGHVRACHGDLHLANLCLVDGKPTLFDAIEFDPAISTIDVLYDLAFLLMDLVHRGFDQGANLVFNRYLDRRDEAGGLAAMRLFLSLRAAIRAQVTCAAIVHRHGQGEVDAMKREAKRYLKLALTLLSPSRPRLIAVGGFSGTGKSSLAYGLAPSIGGAPGARVLRTDVLRKRAFGLAPESRLPQEAYAPGSHRIVYGMLETEAARCLVGGQAVIVDAVFGRAEERRAIRNLAYRLAIPFEAIWLDAPQATLEHRIAGRSGDASDATVAVVRSQVPAGEPPLDWTWLDAGREPAAVLADAARRLDLDPSSERAPL